MEVTLFLCWNLIYVCLHLIIFSYPLRENTLLVIDFFTTKVGRVSIKFRSNYIWNERRMNVHMIITRKEKLWSCGKISEDRQIFWFLCCSIYGPDFTYLVGTWLYNVHFNRPVNMNIIKSLLTLCTTYITVDGSAWYKLKRSGIHH